MKPTPILDTTSYWLDSAQLPSFPPLKRNLEVDVVVIGGGITGVTAAYLYKKAGHTVVLLERDHCAFGETGHTTAHLTYVTDKRLSELVKDLGEDAARATWEAGMAAIDQIVTNIRSEDIECEFKWVPGYLHAPLKTTDLKKETKKLRDEADLAKELGFQAEFLNETPFVGRAGIKFPHQAKFHPAKYLAGLLRTIPGNGSHVFEGTEVSEVQDEPLQVKAGARTLKCRYVVLATHTPLMGKTNIVSATLFQTKLYLYTSYALGAKVPQNALPEASFWDTGDPYYYLRIDRRTTADYAILGGEDHKTGQKTDTAKCYRKLEAVLQKLIPDAKVDHRWCGQVIETPDGLPYIGETAQGQFAATGFSGNGMTFGTLGAMMAVDSFVGRKNPWTKLFDPHRKKIKGAAWTYLKENKDYPYYLVRDWIGGAEGDSLQELKPNEGKVLKLDGKKVAAFRDGRGKVSLCSPVCTHLKCIVAWNKVEQTWDCPCHGSRFTATGKVISGPAEADLEKVSLPKKK